MHDFLLFLRNMRVIAHALRGILLCMGAVIVLLAVLLGHFEQKDFGDALYFTLITSLTVGYGDITPVTPMGKAISVVAAFVGILAMGIYVGMATRAVSASIHGERLSRASGSRKIDHE